MAAMGALACPMSGCKILGSSSPDSQVRGRIVGANHQQGHRIREKEFEKASFPAPSLKTKVVILGGGVSGLSAARYLNKRGIEDLAILELENTLGGNSRGEYYPESRAPWGAHYLPVPTRESESVREILQEIGAIQGYESSGAPIYNEEMICHSPEERLFYLGSWHEGLWPKEEANATDTIQLKEFMDEMNRWRKWRDKDGKRAFTIPLELSSRDPELLRYDQISMEQYLHEKGWDSPLLRFYVEYGTRDDFGSSISNTSAWAGLHYFSCRDGGGFEPTDAQFVWPEGNQHLVNHLAKPFGDRARSGQLVTGVQQDKNGVTVRLWDVSQGRSWSCQADYAVWAMPQFLRRYLLPDSWSDNLAQEFHYAPWVVANLALSELPQELPPTRPGLCWDNVLYHSESLGYVVDTHQGLAVGQHPTVLTWYHPYKDDDVKASRKTMLARTWESWRDEIMNELTPLHPNLPSLVRRLDVMLLGHAMIRPRPTFMWGDHRQQARQPHGRIHFAHSDLSGLSIFEEANFQGERAAKEVHQLLI
jgi:hypothetical protein